MASWKKTIATPFKKACTFFNQQPPRDHKKSHTGLCLSISHNVVYDPLSHIGVFSVIYMLFLCDSAEQENRIMDLHGEVMACGYEDVQVMWSILDKSKSSACNITSS